MNFTIIEFVIQEAFINMVRNKLMTLAAVATMALTLAILGGFGVMGWKLEREVNALPAKFEMRVFFKDGLDVSREKVVQAKIAQSPHVSKVTFTSKEQAWQKAKVEYGSDITQGLPANPMADEIRVLLQDAAMTDDVSSWLSSLPEVEKVVDSRDDVAILLKLLTGLRIAGAILTFILLIASVVIIHNTIRLTISSRKEDIRIMQLIGAASATIRTPFVLEGVVQGLMGAGVALGLLWGVMIAVMNYVKSVLPMGMTDSPVPMGIVASVLALIGMMIGGVVSSISLRRYLKEG